VRRLSLHRVRVAYLVVMAGLVLAFVAGARLVTAVLAAGLTVAAMGYELARRRPVRPSGWFLLAVAVAVSGAAVATAQLSTSTYPTVSDGLFLAGYLPLALGLLLFGCWGRFAGDWLVLLDTVALTLLGGLLVWVTLVRPSLLSHPTGNLANMVTIASWLGYVAVLATCVRVLLVWRTNQAMAALAVAVAVLLGSDYLYEQGRLDDSHIRTGVGVACLGFLIFAALVGFASMHASSAELTAPSRQVPEVGLFRLTLLALALLVAPTMLLVKATPVRAATGVVVVTVAAMVGLLMLVRVVVAVRAYQSRVEADQAERTAFAQLIGATTRTEVLTSLERATHTVLSCKAECDVRVIDADEARTSSPTPRHDGEMVVLVDPATIPTSRGYAVVFTASPGDLSEFRAPLERIAQQAGSALARISLVGALQEEERERYFATLVRTSADPILIERHGLIDYATPSARELFGRDVVGVGLGELVEDLEPADEAAPPAGRPAGATSDSTGASDNTGTGDSTGASDNTGTGDSNGASDNTGTGDSTGASDDTRSGDGARISAGTGIGNGTAASNGTTWMGTVRRPDGTIRAVSAHRRDLRSDPTVRGVVATVRDVTAEQELQRRLAYRATHDALTGLANADVLRDRLLAGREAATTGAISAVLFVDLDDFKNINDTFGHDVGDRLLVTVAARIEQALRTSDLAARLGGDEFAALLSDVPDVPAARTTAQRIADALAEPVTIAGVSMDTGASVGLALAQTPEEVDSLLRRADAALYTAKEEGKGRWRQYEAGMVSPMRRRTDLREELAGIMRDGAWTMHYQPIVEIASGDVVGFEALIRPERGDLAHMAPAELIRVAEENGFIVAVGEWALGRVLADIATLNPPGSPRYVSLNVSPLQLRAPDFVTTVRGQVSASGVDPRQLVLEITERLLMPEDAQAWDFLTQLRHDGIRVAIDDYGSGCASMSYLRQPSIDIVKIDQTFLKDPESPRARLLVGAVVALTTNLELIPIAEGVAEPSARQLLLEVGCRYAQGFLFAPALPAPAAARAAIEGFGGWDFSFPVAGDAGAGSE
jgi:diguanylate cyclase (GGDEF)-like protein